MEAFLDSLKNVKVEPAPERVSPYRYRVTGNLKRKIYLPPMTDQALAARLEELSIMQQIDRELNAASLNLEKVINLTLEWAMRNTGATAGAVGLVDYEQRGVAIGIVRKL